MRPKGRYFGMATTVICVLALLGTAIGMKAALIEAWYLWKLNSKEGDERKIAAEKLGEMKSRRAIRSLIERIRKQPTVANGTNPYVDAIAKIGPPAVLPLADELGSPDHDVRLLSALALQKIGPSASEAVPALVMAIKKNMENECVYGPLARSVRLPATPFRF